MIRVSLKMKVLFILGKLNTLKKKGINFQRKERYGVPISDRFYEKAVKRFKKAFKDVFEDDVI
ncbi:hypothetical protein, partial [Streptomyces caniscabiei]|uniref:hypothetical protein n=1 Tax=Streptomyces caniscabiei TaxID=2746961 RepID=UPI0038F6558B